MSGSAAQPEQAPVEVTKQAPPVEDAGPATEQPTTDEPEDQLTEDAKKAAVKELTAKGTELFGQKKFEEAAEVFSKATAYQAELNGETAPENAEVLFYYGRSLFKVGQSKSDVLGGAAAGEKKATNGDAAAAPAAEKAEEKAEAPKEAVPDAKKPLFQFTGDENFDGDDDDEEAEGEEEEEEDDLATAFEILDLARVCFTKQLDALTTEGKGKEAGMSADERRIKERLADTHDALSEISLENERYPNAVEDGRTALGYKMELYPQESEIIAEAHYKLSLALEFASVTTATPEGDEPKEGEEAKTEQREVMDQGLRDEAVEQMELALKSFKLKLTAKQKELAAAPEGEENSIGRKAVIEMKELIAEMETRLVDLLKDPLNAKDFLSGPDNALGGLLGALSGETPEQTKARVEAATANANSVQSLVRKKPKAAPAPAAAAKPEISLPAPAPSKNKRKAEDDLEETNGSESPKKAKVDE